jgi:hypothetical protein
LLVEPNDAFIGPKVEELRKLQTSIVHLSTILRRVDRVQRVFPAQGDGRRGAIVGLLRNSTGCRPRLGRSVRLPRAQSLMRSAHESKTIVTFACCVVRHVGSGLLRIGWRRADEAPRTRTHEEDRSAHEWW